MADPCITRLREAMHAYVEAEATLRRCRWELEDALWAAHGLPRGVGQAEVARDGRDREDRFRPDVERP